MISYTFSLKYHYTIKKTSGKNKESHQLHDAVLMCSATLACEQQTYFRSSLLSLRRERSDDRKYVCCSQAMLPQSLWQQCRKCFAITEGELSTGHQTYLLSSAPFIPWWPKIRDSYSVKMSSTWQKAHLKKKQTQTQGLSTGIRVFLKTEIFSPFHSLPSTRQGRFQAPKT